MTTRRKLQTTFLMPDYDEYGMSYKDRSAIFSSGHIGTRSPHGPVYDRMIIVDGKIEGTWKRTIKKNMVAVELVPFTLFSNKQKVIHAAKRYSLFIVAWILLLLK